MDKFVKRLSEDEYRDVRKAKRPRLKQATIQSLKVRSDFIINSINSIMHIIDYGYALARDP